jgi:hypothetical protein
MFESLLHGDVAVFDPLEKQGKYFNFANQECDDKPPQTARFPNRCKADDSCSSTGAACPW